MRAHTKSSIRRKTIRIDQDKLDRAVELLGARSEAEALDQALDCVIMRHELLRGVRRIAGKGGVDNFFDVG